MRVLSVTFPFAPTSLNAAGGSEQVAAMLDRGLRAAGHESIVIAAEGSEVSGDLIALPAGGQPATHNRWRNAIESCLASRRPDIVHMHGMDFERYLPDTDCPVLATLHLPPSFYSPQVFHLTRPRTWLNCVSHSQLRSCPPSADIIGVIANGVPVNHLAPAHRPPSDYVAAIGRICPEKGFHFAVEAAVLAGMPLYLAGKVFPYPDHLRYWHEVLEPRLTPPHRFLGPVDFARKPAFLAGARCLLVPSIVEETSSLVAMEAMACGTPVVAFSVGALSEIVEHGRTGFLVRDVHEMAEAIVRTAAIDRAACRRTACARFSDKAMIDNYFQLYKTLLNSAANGAGVFKHSTALELHG